MTDTERTEMLETTLDALALGIFLVAADGRVIFMNRIAESFAKSGDPLRIVQGRLVPKEKPQALEFNAVLTRCLTRQALPSPQPLTVALPRSGGGGGLIATVFCQQPRTTDDNQTVQPAVASIMVQDPGLISRLPGEAFAQLYSLTQAELRVAMAMVPGATPQGAAEALGISCNTVKTHLQRIFEKTSTSRQSDLVALMLRTTPPLVA